MTRLVNLGSLCIDRVYRVSSISVPGETVASKSFSIYPGGKGLNQSLAAAKAGASVSHHGCIGTDGSWLKDVLKSGGVDESGVDEVAGETGHAVIQVDDSGQNSIVIVGGTNRTIKADKVENVIATMSNDDWLLLQNEINDIETVIDVASQHNVHVAFNVAPVDGREQNYDISNIEILIVNEVEAAALAGVANPNHALETLTERFPKSHVILTLGSEGLLYGFGRERDQQTAYAVHAVDETAAGDAFIGYFMAGVLRGMDIPDALRDGSIAGAYAVTKQGAAVSIPSREQFLEFQASLAGV